MAERLGIVLYWAFTFLAVGWVLFIRFNSDDPTAIASMYEVFIAVIPAMVLFLIGKGLRHILSGY